MIRVPVSKRALFDLIRSASPDWLPKAQVLTSSLPLKPGENWSSIWGDIKEVFIRLQIGKCVYCERRLEHPRFGKIEHDVEHFRPKSSVRKWPPEKMSGERGLVYDFDLGEDWEDGYYLLAYHPLNYATSCKTCNTILKNNYFPVAGARRQAESPEALKEELPFLIYPLGTIDSDPESLIRFEGIIPVPRYKSGHRSRRARVTIDFFELDARENLREERAEAIAAIHTAVRLEQIGDESERTYARRVLKARTSSAAAHTNCARCFHRLCRTDPQRASLLAEAALEILPEQ